MALNATYKSGNAVTVSSTEMSLCVDGGSTTLQSLTDVGFYTLILDCSAMVKGDEFELLVKEKAHGSATQRTVIKKQLKHAKNSLFVLPGLFLGLGFDITLKKISATDRAFAWSVRRAS